MSNAAAATNETHSKDVPFQEASVDIWSGKYRLKDANGNPVDQDMGDTERRVARALADVERTQGGTKKKADKWYKEFLWALDNGAVPAGRILSNAGSQDYKPDTSTINCTVSGTVFDSMDNILARNHEAGLTLKKGAGIGYEFSTLRPKGAYVAGAGASTSGPLSFMDIFDRMCTTVSSAGGRRGAQMATFDIHHPDVMDFISAKREDGRLRQFNLSLLITSDFVQAVRDNAMWKLSFPTNPKEVAALGLDLEDPEQVIYRPFPSDDENYYTNESGDVACRVYKTIPARTIWDIIMESTYDFAEPGFILIDEVNRMNNNWFCEHIRASNPCGEQMLPPYGSCLLGSINLTKLVRNPFTKDAAFDWERFSKLVRIFTRMLDNVVEINNLPLEQQRNEILNKRRHGMGIFGLGSALAMLRMPYGEADSVAFTEKVNKEMALEGWREGVELAKEKGAAPVLDQEFEITPKMMELRPELKTDGYDVGDKVAGRVLHAKYSHYMQRIGEADPQIVKEMIDHGARFTHHTSIAPTGTIALSMGNNASNGIEPSFSHHYARNIIREGRNTKEKVDVFSFELLAYRHLVNEDAMPFSEHPKAQLPSYFTTTDDVTPKQHVDIQAAAQKWIDSSISKTANVPQEFPYEDFKDIYMYAYDNGLKGCTTFRFNPEAFQGVLVKQEDLANTTYEFVIENGEKVYARGDEIINYNGEEVTAANLYDALKEGTYGTY